LIHSFLNEFISFLHLLVAGEIAPGLHPLERHAGGESDVVLAPWTKKGCTKCGSSLFQTLEKNLVNNG